MGKRRRVTDRKPLVCPLCGSERINSETVRFEPKFYWCEEPECNAESYKRSYFYKRASRGSRVKE